MNEFSILVIYDSRGIQNLMKTILNPGKYRVLQASKGLDGLSLFYSNSPQLVLLGMRLPDIDSLEVLKLIRAKSNIPVIAVSEQATEKDKVLALDCGADDFVTVPFHVEELLTRIRVALRRVPESASRLETAFSLDYLKVDFERRKVSVHGKPVHLTPLEYKILVLLVNNRGKTLTNQYLQEQLWGADAGCDYRRLRVFMASVRKKLDDRAGMPRFIKTETGIGYSFADE